VISGGLAAFAGKRVLLLQGPLGPFFKHLAADLRDAGATVLKINFTGGDVLFSSQPSIMYRKGLDEWGPFFENVLETHNIDTVLLFGDCRPMHLIAHGIAARRNVEIGVFEEGYIRPDYVTLERHGVNGHSRIPRSFNFYLRAKSGAIPPVRHVGNMFWHAACWAVLYYLASAIMWPVFDRYQHHRPLSVLEAIPWVRSVWRKVFYRRKERGIQRRLATELSKRFYLVPLQVYNDAQVHTHSDFSSVEEFMGHVIASFAANAEADTVLVIKHHPMDRGYHDYSRLIHELGMKAGVPGRVMYIHDQHLPTLLDHARGVVLINSTVGLSALTHGAPLKCCGSALYDIEGLTFQGTLDEFWDEAASFSPNRELFQQFLGYLIDTTQLNGSFYRRLQIPGSAAGLVWERPKRIVRLVESLAPSVAEPHRRASDRTRHKDKEEKRIAKGR
jgi:capsular polysaccharide export protein